MTPFAQHVYDFCMATSRACIWSSTVFALLSIATYTSMLNIPCVPVMGNVTMSQSMSSSSFHDHPWSESCIATIEYMTHEKRLMEGIIRVPNEICSMRTRFKEQVMVSYAALDPSHIKYGIPDIHVVTLLDSFMMLVAGILGSAYLGMMTLLIKFTLFMFAS